MNVRASDPLRARPASRAARRWASPRVGWLLGAVILLAAGPLFGQADPNRILVYHTDSPGGDPIEEQIFEVGTAASDTLELYIVEHLLAKK